MRLRLILLPMLVLGWLLACGGGGSSTPPPVPTGTLTLRLGADSFPGYTQAVVSIEKVEASTDGSSWTALGTVKNSYDLLALQNGHSTGLITAATLTAATYTQFRITWATVNYQSGAMQPAYVILSGGTGQLAMPVTTIGAGSVVVPGNGSATALLMLSGQQAVQLRNGAYTFQATGRAYDLSAVAQITGHLGYGTTALPGVEVYAETVDGSGLATIQRRAFTDASGNYALEGLPAGNLYFVVAQPAGATLSYAAVAATPVNATTPTTYLADLAFSAPLAPGSLTLTITPASLATQGTWGELRQTLPTGSVGTQALIVRSQSVASGLTQDLAGILGLAPGTYGITAQRSTSGATPTMKVGTQVLVSSGGTATTLVTYP